MRTRIAIDPNVRVRGNETYAGLEDVEGDPVVGDEVEVWEPESGVSGFGRVTEIDDQRSLVYVAVDWMSLHERRSWFSVSTGRDTVVTTGTSNANVQGFTAIPGFSAPALRHPTEQQPATTSNRLVGTAAE